MLHFKWKIANCQKLDEDDGLLREPSCLSQIETSAKLQPYSSVADSGHSLFGLTSFVFCRGFSYHSLEI